MPTAEEILDAIAPELASAPNKALHLELAEDQTGKVFGSQRNHAVALLAAHTLTVAKRGGSSGQVSSLNEGQLSVSFSGKSDMGQLGTTSYGDELMRLRRQNIMAARTVKV